jgi:hypothetical protein
VGLNCIANEKIAKKTKFKNLYIFPACSDSGMPFGLAIWAYHNIFNQTKRIKFENAYTGKKYKKKDIRLLLKNFKIPYKKSKLHKIAELLVKNKIFGIFQGGSEYGPRALGNRSIIANPSSKWMRDHINTNIKNRELFRPFAPIVLKQYSKEFFDVKDSPYMLRAGPCKKYNIIPAVNHVDNTSRVQTITKRQNSKIYEIITNFNRLIKIPIILNTSFNDAGEPLVETPLDSLISFLSTKLDYLVLEDYLIDASVLKNKNILLKELKNFRKININKFHSHAKKQLLDKSFFSLDINKIIKIRNNFLYKELRKEKILNFKNFFNSIKRNEKYLIIGTIDHTNKLLKLIGKLDNKHQNLYFYQFKKNDFKNNSKHSICNIKKILNLKKYSWSKILISTHQFQDQIENFLIQKGMVNFDNCYKNYYTNIIDSY